MIAPHRVITDIEWPIPGGVGVAALTTIAAAGVLAGASDAAIRRGSKLAGAQTPRMRRYTVGNRLFVQDCYNASPEATVGALESLARLAPGRPLVAVLGDMLELGKYAPSMHYAVGRGAAALGFSLLIAYGRHAAHTALGALDGGMEKGAVLTFGTEERATLIETARRTIPENAAVLFKASGRIRMKEICEEIGREE